MTESRIRDPALAAQFDQGGSPGTAAWPPSRTDCDIDIDWLYARTGG